MLLLGLSLSLCTPSQLQAQEEFRVIQEHVRSQVQERRSQVQFTSSPTPSPATRSGFFSWWSQLDETSPPKAPVLLPEDKVLHHLVGEWVVVRRVSGQLYLSIGAR
jgi:hypothetical protein